MSDAIFFGFSPPVLALQNGPETRANNYSFYMCEYLLFLTPGNTMYHWYSSTMVVLEYHTTWSVNLAS